MMKRLYSMLMFSAALPMLGAQTSHTPVSLERVDVSHREFMTQNKIRPQKTLTAVEGEEIIVTPPSNAEIKMYTRSALGYSVRWGQAYQERDEGIVGEIAFCDNGDVYLKNPISFRPLDSWVRGKKEGNSITFTFPQLVAIVPADDGVEDSEMMEVWVNVVKADYDNPSDFAFEFDSTMPNEITMSIDDDGNVVYKEETTQAEIGGQEYTFPIKMMALTTSNNVFLGYGDYDDTYVPFNETPTLIPESLTSLDYAMTFGEGEKNGKWVKIAFDDQNSKVYIAGVYTPEDKGFESLAESAIVGDIYDGGAGFMSRQYVGIDPYYYHTYVSGGTVSSTAMGQYLDIEDIYYMSMDDKRSKLTSSNTMVVSEGENQGYVLDVFRYPIFDAQDGYIDPNPSEPLVTGFMPYTPQYGYGGVKVKIPNTNKNGQLLRAENLSYSIIINDKQITFNPEDYPEFSEPTTWIPFNFSSYNVEIDPYTINTRMIFMTEELSDVHTMSVQSRYKDNDTYYVTNGQTYVYKLPQFEMPTFEPASGYEFTGEEGEVTITAPEDAIVSYRIISDESSSPEFIDSESNVVKVTVTKNCFIQAFSKDPDDDDERASTLATATYTFTDTSLTAISAQPDEDAQIFTIDGVRVNREVLEPGLYIVIKSGKASRILVK